VVSFLVVLVFLLLAWLVQCRASVARMLAPTDEPASLTYRYVPIEMVANGQKSRMS
jgi:hypothetical protein